MPTVLDLCSGLGGASEAFAQAGWTVIRIENNPELSYVPFTKALNVLDWEEWIDATVERVDLVWASPPCTEFSLAYGAPKPTAQRAGLDFKPDMSIFQACLDIIDYLKPKHWVIENVHGAVGQFGKVIGEYHQKIGPFYLWGNFPRIVLPYTFRHMKSQNDVWSDNPLRANLKAIIPFEISFALLESLTRQWTLDRWSDLGEC